MVGALLRVGAVAVIAMSVASAQEAPRRPRLPQDADTNDWQSYFDYGSSIIQKFPNRADTLFAWASRLDPSRAEPLYGRWVTFWMSDISRFSRWIDEDRRIVQSPAVLRQDTLYNRALDRNPFVPQMLMVYAVDQLPGEWRQDRYSLGWVAYARHDFAEAAKEFGDLVRSNPRKHARVRYQLAMALVSMRAYDSAATEMNAWLASLRAREDTSFSIYYYSKEWIEYSVGLLHLVQGHSDSAEAAFGRALEENLAFFPAHAMLGDLALARHDTGAASRSYGQAADLASDEPWILHRYGTALLRMGRVTDAIRQLERAVALDSLYADPYLVLGVAKAATADTMGARRALQQFIARAPLRQADAIADAQRRLANLEARKP